MARDRATNPQPLVALQYNPYQQAFLNARRLRFCRATCSDLRGERLSWSALERRDCPICHQPGIRAFRFFYLRAGRRGGKTRVGALSAIEELTIPDSKGWICAPSYPELQDYVMPAFFDQLPSDWFNHPLTDWNEDRMHLRMPNGAEVSFRSLDDPNRGAGPGLDWVWIDEGRKIQVLAWHLLRPSLTERKGICYVTSTPDWGDDWCHENFWVPAEEGRPGYWAVEYRTVDNPTIDPAEVALAAMTMPPTLFRREYLASREFPTGTIYSEVLEEAIVDDNAIREWLPEWPNIDPTRPCIAAIDPGTDHPFAGCLIVATPMGLIVVREYLERNRPYIQHVNGSLDKPQSLKQMVAGVTPRWCIDKSAPQASIELSQHGIYCTPAENAVEAGIQRVYSWMSVKRLRIAKSTCPRLVKYMRMYRWAELKESARGLPAGSPFKKDDDLPDALRYGLMTWPELPTKFVVAVDDPTKRNLLLLSPEVRATIERNLVADDEAGEGLVRVTDDFMPQIGRDVPASSGDGPIADFYR
jgi:hypothetical protein